MDADGRRYVGPELTEAVIGCAYRVANTLGVGFLEKVYENALVHELRKAGLEVEQQVPLSVVYDGVVVGEYFADLVVEGCVIVELKHVKAFDNAHVAQALHYLKATKHTLALLVNFGSERVEIRRVVLNHPS